MGGIDEVSATIGELRSDVRNQSEQTARLSSAIDRLQAAIDKLQRAESERGGFNKAVALASGMIGGIVSPILGWAMGLLHVSIK